MTGTHAQSNTLLERLETRYFRSFLPLVLTRAYAHSLMRHSSVKIPYWDGSNGHVALFLAAPAKIKIDPQEKPRRLGKVIKRLAWCYRQNLTGKIRMANEVLKTLFKATDSVAVAFSGGRDSLVALHLTIQMKPDVKVVLVNTGIEFPESLTYTRDLAKAWQLNFYEANPHVSFWQIGKDQGIPVAGRGNTTFMRDLAERSGVKLSNSCCRRMKETPARQFYQHHEIEGVVTGLRVAESLMRKLNFADYGALRYSGTYDTINAWPLYAWKDEDIEAYIRKFQLPINPLYELGYKRVGCWPCLQDMLYKDSRLFTLQRKHPQMYKTVRKKFGPEMISLLNSWAGIEKWGFDESDLDSLYRPCSFELLDDYRKGQLNKSKPRKTASSYGKKQRPKS